jgi:hypothetical protein
MRENALRNRARELFILFKHTTTEEKVELGENALEGWGAFTVKWNLLRSVRVRSERKRKTEGLKGGIV